MVMGHRLVEAAAHSLAPDPFCAKNAPKDGAGFHSLRDQGGSLRFSGVEIFDRYGGEFSIGIVDVAAGNRDSRPPSPQGSTGFAGWQVPHPTSRLSCQGVAG
jgi:hypothetical protein